MRAKKDKAVRNADGKWQKGHRVPGANIFPKGVSGNPKGCPPLPRFQTVIEKALSAIGENERETVAEELIRIAIKFARKGDFRFWNALVERWGGKVPDVITGPDGEKLVIEVVYRKPEADADDSA